MDGSVIKKSSSPQTAVFKNIAKVDDLKAKLTEIVTAGKDYDYDVSDSLKGFLLHTDQEVVVLTIKAVAEFAKCEEKRKIYAEKDFIEPIIDAMQKEANASNTELVKSSCRALGNLCCDSDAGRNAIITCNGLPVLAKILKRASTEKCSSEGTLILAAKSLSNFAFGEREHTEALVEAQVFPILQEILTKELAKKDEMNDDLVSTVLLILLANIENSPEFLYEPEVNKSVLNVLKETVNYEISDICLDILHAQAQNDSVKNLLAVEKGVHLVCSRLSELVRRHEAGGLTADDSEVQRVMAQAADLVVMVLTGDEAMELLYAGGKGEVYRTLVQWLDESNQHLLTAAVLAAGNFARSDTYCIAMMEEGLYDKLLDIFEAYLEKGKNAHTAAQVTIATRIQHGALSGIRNLSVPKANKQTVVEKGRAAPLLVGALPFVTDHHVAYKLQAAIRMLADGHDDVALQLVNNEAALAAVAKWGTTGQSAGAVGEAPRLLAWVVKQLRGQHCTNILKVEGCISCVVNMLVVCHSIMQNESILALTLIAAEAFKAADTDHQSTLEDIYIKQVTAADIGQRINMLIEGNLTKMPVEVAENLLTFLHVTSNKIRISTDYKKAGVHTSLRKFRDSRKDFTDNMKKVLDNVAKTIEKAPDYQNDD